MIDKIPFVTTSIPKVIDYPIKTEKALMFVASLLGIVYDESWLNKVKSVFNIIRASS